MPKRVTFTWEMTASLTVPEDDLCADEIVEKYGSEIDVTKGDYVEDSFSLPFVDEAPGKNGPYGVAHAAAAHAGGDASGAACGCGSGLCRTYGPPARVLNTLLAALRYYQEGGQGEPENRSDVIHEIATNAGRDISLDALGIDALCEALNAGDLALVEAAPAS